MTSPESYFDGVLMAYDDCSKFARHLAENVNAGMANSDVLSARDMEMVQTLTRLVLTGLADSFDTKSETVRQMVAAAKNGVQ